MRSPVIKANNTSRINYHNEQRCRITLECFGLRIAPIKLERLWCGLRETLSTTQIFPTSSILWFMVVWKPRCYWILLKACPLPLLANTNLRNLLLYYAESRIITEIGEFGFVLRVLVLKVSGSCGCKANVINALSCHIFCVCAQWVALPWHEMSCSEMLVIKGKPI